MSNSTCRTGGRRCRGYRRWTPADEERLRLLWPSMTGRAAGEVLGRPEGAVIEKARRLGLAREHRPTSSYAGVIREMHGRGCHDAEIAAAVGCCRELISYHRRRLGLPALGRTGRDRAAAAARTRRQVREAGCRTLVEVRWLTHRVASLRRGWPAANTSRQCDVLDVLEGGPRTQAGLAAALGLRPAAADSGWVGCLLRQLRRLGLVVCEGRKFRPGGRGRSRAVYALAPGVARDVPESRRQKSAAPPGAASQGEVPA